MMSLSQSIFGKELYDLGVSDLEKYFQTEQEETSVLEYKSGNVSLENIYKEVSGFLNTQGGILIIGAPKEKEILNGRIKRKVCVGKLDPTVIIKDQDALIRSIASNISPAPVGIKAKELVLETGKAFILEITQSITPPHQVNDEGKYYIRLERDCKAAPHGIVEALFLRRQKPLLNCELSFKRGNFDNTLTVVLNNFSDTTAENINYMLIIKGSAGLTRNAQIGTINYEHDGIRIQVSDPSFILVRDVIYKQEYLFKSHHILYIECVYWCKDGKAESIAKIYNTRHGISISEYDSKNRVEGQSLESIRKEYDDLLNP